MENTEGASQKEWNAEIIKQRGQVALHVTWGRIGNPVNEKTYIFKTEQEAQVQLERAKKSKIKGGYRDTSAPVGPEGRVELPKEAGLQGEDDEKYYVQAVLDLHVSAEVTPEEEGDEETFNGVHVRDWAGSEVLVGEDGMDVIYRLEADKQNSYRGHNGF